MHQVNNLSASAVGPMLDGYCGDFVNLAASLAQTLEQVKMRNLPFEQNRSALQRVERGMRDLADAIGSLLQAPPQPTEPEPPARRRARGTAPPPGPDPLPGKCIMQGSTEDLPIASVFQFLGQTRKTGVLRVQADGETVTFTLTSGKIESTATDRPPSNERLGDLLLELGLLSRAQIEPLAQQNRLLGGELLRAGLLTNDQLLQALRVQMQRRYQRVAAAKPASYVFHETAPAEAGRVQVSAGELRAGARPQPAQR